MMEMRVEPFNYNGFKVELEKLHLGFSFTVVGEGNNKAKLSANRTKCILTVLDENKKEPVSFFFERLTHSQIENENELQNVMFFHHTILRLIKIREEFRDNELVMTAVSLASRSLPYLETDQGNVAQVSPAAEPPGVSPFDVDIEAPMIQTNDILQAIDEALDQRNEEEFMRLTNLLKDKGGEH
jgi:hypothetical protein